MRKLSISEKKRNETSRKVKKYMASVEEFIRRNNSGEVPVELSASMELLATYYATFLQINDEISLLDSILVEENGRTDVHPLFKTRDGVVTRLDGLLKSLGLTFKEQTRLKIIDVSKPETNPLDEWMAKEVR